MKYQTTKKNVIANGGTIICLSYCAIQHLLHGHNANAYTCGVYGWNADIYNINGVTIVTGYRPFGNIRPNYETTKRYDDLAREIINAPYKDKLNTIEEYREETKNRDEKLNALLNDFIKEVLENDHS